MKVHNKSTGIRTSLFDIFIYHFLFMFLCSSITIEASEWRAGTSSVIITPEESVWMAGYGAGQEPSQGKIHDLYVKALALEGPEGNRVIITSADLLGITGELSNEISREINRRFGIPREALLFNTSHTHCGPEVRSTKIYFAEINKVYTKKLYAYVERLKTSYLKVIGEAINNLQPANLSFSSVDPIPFAVSRRFPSENGILYRSSPSSYYTGGPRDNVVPVLKVVNTDGTIQAILFGYACHPITLKSNLICGDYPGFAQQYIEETYPGAIALFIQGCAGQLVPNARFQLEYAMGHGKALADVVTQALDGEQIQISGPLKCAYDEIALEFEPVPERKVLEENQKSNNSGIQRKASYLLEKLDKNEQIETTLQCPLQVIRFGENLLLIGLSGEPVVEYSIKFKSEFLTQFVWVAGYCNYEFGYLPTWRILKEGGYEARMRGMPFSGPFTDTVEKRVIEGVRRLVKKVTN